MVIRPLRLHSWNVTPGEAIAIQEALRRGLDCVTRSPQRMSSQVPICLLMVIGAVAGHTYTFPRLEEIERRSVRMKLTFPYVPGLLAFREAPVLLAGRWNCFQQGPTCCCLMAGIAHGRRMGIATHMGILLNKPTIGCRQVAPGGDV